MIDSMPELNCYGQKQTVVIDDDGSMVFACPACGQKTRTPKDYFKIEGSDIRSTRTLFCPNEKCGIVYDIARSSFVSWEPDEVMDAQTTNLLKRTDKTTKVMREYNARHKRN